MSSALDRLLGQTLESMIREKLGQKTCEKIEVRLRQRYNLDLAASINDFYTLDATLREFFASGADAIEEDFANNLISINTPAKGRRWILIQNSELAELILATYGDKDKRLILEVAFTNPSVILDILEATRIPKSSGYRLINQLVENGLLTEQGYAESSDGKKVNKYTALFESVKIEIDTSGLIFTSDMPLPSFPVVEVLLKENILNESQIIRVLLRGKKLLHTNTTLYKMSESTHENTVEPKSGLNDKVLLLIAGLAVIYQTFNYILPEKEGELSPIDFLVLVAVVVCAIASFLVSNRYAR